MRICYEKFERGSELPITRRKMKKSAFGHHYPGYEEKFPHLPDMVAKIPRSHVTAEKIQLLASNTEKGGNISTDLLVGPSFRIVMRTVNLPSRKMATLSDNHCWTKETDINEAI